MRFVPLWLKGSCLPQESYLHPVSATSYFKGLSWLVFLNLLIKPVWVFLIDRKVQLEVGHEVYGQYFACLALSYVLLFIADAGLSTLMNRELAGDPQHALRPYLRLKLGMLMVYGFVCFLTAAATGLHQWTFLAYVALIQGLTSLYVFLRNILTAHQQFSADAVFSVIDKTLMILFCGALLYLPFSEGLSLERFLQIQTFCTALAVGAISVFLLRRHWLAGERPLSYVSLLRQVLPFGVIILLQSLHFRLDGFLLERLHPQGAAEAGIYAAAYRLLDAGNMAGYMVASFLVPFVARHRRDPALIAAAVLRTRDVLLLPSLALVAFALYFSPWLTRLLYHQSDTYLPHVLLLVLAALPAYYLVQVYGSVLTATGRLRAFIYVLTGSVAVNVVLNLILIPSYGAAGSAWAALASQYLGAAGCLLAAQQVLRIPLNPRSILRYGSCAGLLLLLFYGGKSAGWDVWIILASAALLVAAFLAAQTGAFKNYFASSR